MNKIISLVYVRLLTGGLSVHGSGPWGPYPSLPDIMKLRQFIKEHKNE